jgi:hypothetical protein
MYEPILFPGSGENFRPLFLHQQQTHQKRSPFFLNFGETQKNACPLILDYIKRLAHQQRPVYHVHQVL